MQLLLTNESISNGKLSVGLAILVSDGVIQRVGAVDEVKKEIAPDTDVIDLRQWMVAPGYVDIHVHGGNSYDTMDGTYEAINGLSLYKINEGVTSFCPTTVTASDEKTDDAFRSVNEALKKGVDGAKIIGLFLEGPYINAKNKGAHPEEYIRPVSLSAIETLVSKGHVVSFAIAPELPGALEAIEWLAQKGINVRIGHSSATLAETDAGVGKGASVTIHTYNAMSALNHREPGMVGAVMTNENLYAEIICDLVHVHPRAVKALAQAKGADRTILVTDCMRAGGLPDGEYYLGELPVKVRDGIARLDDNALAGSTATLSACVKNMHETVGIPLADAITMATATPAKALHLYDKIGSLDEGKRADIIALDENLNVRFVMVDGVVKRDA